jgi:hypothetical protein
MHYWRQPFLSGWMEEASRIWIDLFPDSAINSRQNYWHRELIYKQNVESGSWTFAVGSLRISSRFWHWYFQYHSHSLVPICIIYLRYNSNWWNSLLDSWFIRIIEDYEGSADQPQLLRGGSHIPVSYNWLILPCRVFISTDIMEWSDKLTAD